MKNKKVLIVSLIAFFIVILDQFTKLLILGSLEENQRIVLINNVFHLTFVKNTGAGFGILKGFGPFLIVFSIVVIGIILYYLKEIGEREHLLQLLMAFVLGGTVGNLIDRLRLGYVVDFLDFRIWPVFNSADSFVTIGVIGLIIYFWKR